MSNCSARSIYSRLSSINALRWGHVEASRISGARGSGIGFFNKDMATFLVLTLLPRALQLRQLLARVSLLICREVAVSTMQEVEAILSSVGLQGAATREALLAAGVLLV